MKKRLSIVALLACSFAVCFAAFADLSGKWKGTLKFNDFEIALNYTFKVDGDKLTGSIGSEQGETPISDGKIKGNEFSFSLDFNGEKLPHTGTYYGDSTIIISEFQGQKNRIKLTRVQ